MTNQNAKCVVRGVTLHRDCFPSTHGAECWVAKTAGELSAAEKAAIAGLLVLISVAIAI